MNIKQESLGNLVILTLDGRLDTMNFALLESELTAVVENNHKDIILDCQDIAQIIKTGQGYQREINHL
jgi:anti-anti-sigma regulatory factor